MLLCCTDHAHFTDAQDQDYFPWTLVHGDFHPNNLFMTFNRPSTDSHDHNAQALAASSREKQEEEQDELQGFVGSLASSDMHVHHCACGCIHLDAEVKLLDFDMVGLGSGPQELGQYLISNMHPATRRTHERNLVCTVY